MKACTCAILTLLAIIGFSGTTTSKPIPWLLSAQAEILPHSDLKGNIPQVSSSNSYNFLSAKPEGSAFLQAGEQLKSPSGNCYLHMQGDGNLVVYKSNCVNRPDCVIWHSHTNVGAGKYFLAMQNDGNLVIYQDQKGSLWNSGSSIDPIGDYFFLTLQDDENLVIYRGTGPTDNRGAVWSSKAGLLVTPKPTRVAQGTSQRGQTSKGLESLYFPGKTFFSSRNVSFTDDLPLLGTTVFFSESRKQQSSPRQVVDMFIRMELNAESIREQWQQKVVEMVQDTGGCSKQIVHSLSMTPGADYLLHGYFHVRYENRRCGGGLFDGTNFTVETDVWNDMALSVSGNKKNLTLSMTGRSSNNVSQFIKDAAKLVGNLAAIFPFTSIVLRLDEHIFAALKAEREALEAAARKLDLKSLGIPNDEIENFKLDLIYDDAGFDNIRPAIIGAVVQLRTSTEHPLTVGQAKAIRKLLSQ